MDLGNGEHIAGHQLRALGVVADTSTSLEQVRRRRDPRDHCQLQRQIRARVNLRRHVATDAPLEVVPDDSALRRLTGLAESIDGGSPEHSRRVGRAAEAVAARMGLDPHFVGLIRDAAPLHDLGKLEIPMAILDKPGPLTTRERIAMQRHAAAGEAICRHAGADPVLRLAAHIARSHHERWDGRGYPDGLSFDRIPLAARIVAVVDVYDALVAERPYKGAWPVEKAIEFLEENAGTQFDPDVVAAFVTLHARGELGSVA